jgi:hypothetical protein
MLYCWKGLHGSDSEARDEDDVYVPTSVPVTDPILNIVSAEMAMAVVCKSCRRQDEMERIRNLEGTKGAGIGEECRGLAT